MTCTDPQLPGGAEVVVRRATPQDAEAVAHVHSASRAAAEPAMPRGVHSPQEVRAWLAGRLAPDSGDETWVAVRGAADGTDGTIVGYALLTPAWLEDLYVHPGHARRGVGSLLLEVCKAVRPGGFELWVFDSNAGARAFYRSHGLVELEHTDGAGNEERCPDLRMAWPGQDPLRFYRGLIDATDAELALLLARRAALTAAVQPHKPVPGHRGRDADRERAIARAMGERAPSLPPATWERLVDAIVTASLDAAGDPRRSP